jgi:hypothetical protein
MVSATSVPESSLFQTASLPQPVWRIPEFPLVFRIFYDLGQGSLGGVSSFFPYSASKINGPAPFPLSPQDAVPPAITANPPVNTILLADPHLKLPRTYQWNIALEQSVGSSQSLSLTYLGALGRDLLRATKRFNVNPNFSLLY